VALVASATLVGPAPASAATTRESRMLEKINHTRTVRGLHPLRFRADLMAAAKGHTRSMAGSRTLFHTPSFSSLCCWRAVAENVAYGSSVRGLHRQFMHSPPHRANLLDRRMREVGIGIVKRDGYLWVTEVFRQPA
jgi:uncharacterized protein YkwD